MNEFWLAPGTRTFNLYENHEAHERFLFYFVTGQWIWKVTSENVEIFSKCKNNICDYVKSGGRVNISEMTHDDSDCQLLVSQQS